MLALDSLRGRLRDKAHLSHPAQVVAYRPVLGYFAVSQAYEVHLVT